MDDGLKWVANNVMTNRWEIRYEECKQYFKCTHPSGNQGFCGHVGTFGELSEHFARHTKQYRIRCSNCEQRFVEEGFYFLHLNINNKKGCQEEHWSDIRHSAESVRVVWKSRNNHIKASTKEEYDDFIADKASKTPVTPTINAKSRSAPRDQRQSVKKPRNEQVCQEKEAVETNPIPVNQPVQSNESLPDAQRNVLNPQSVSSSPESAADLQLTDAERTPGGFVSTETRPPSQESVVGAEQSPASVPQLRQNQEYEQPINNGFPSDSWRPPSVPVDFDPSRPPPLLGVQVPIPTPDSRQPQPLGRHRIEQETAPQHRRDQSDSTAQHPLPSRTNPVPLSSAFSALDLGHQDSETGQRTGDFPVSSSDHSLRGPEDLKMEPTQDQNTIPAQRASSPQPVPPPNPGQYSLNDLSVPWSTEQPRLSYHRNGSMGSSTIKSAQTAQRPVEPQVVRQNVDPPAATRTAPVENQEPSQQQTERRSLEQEHTPNLDPLRHFRGLCSIRRSSQVTTAVRTGQPETSLFQFPAIAVQQPRTAPDVSRPEPIAVRTDSQNELDENEIVHQDSVHDFDHDLGRNEPMDISVTDSETEDQQPAATIPQDAQTPPGSPEARDSEPEQTRLSGRPPSSTGSRPRRVRQDSDVSYRPDSPVRRPRSKSAAKHKKKRGPAKPRKGARGRKSSNRRRSAAKESSEDSEDSNMFDDDDVAPAVVPIRGAPSAPIQQNPVDPPSSDLPDYESSPDDEPVPAPAPPPRRGRPPARASQVAKPVAKRTRPPTPEDSEDSVESYHPPQKTTRGRRRSSGAREYDYDPPYRPPVANVSARPTERRRTRSQGAAEPLELPKTTRRRKSVSTVQKDTALDKLRQQLLRQRTPEQVLRARTPEQVLRQQTPELEISDHDMEERAPRDLSVEGEDEYEEVVPVQEVPRPDIQEIKEEPREEPVQRRSRPEFRRPVGAGSPDIEIISHVRNGRVLSLFSNPSTRESSLARQGSEQRDQPQPSAAQTYPVDREFYDRNRVESRGSVQNLPRNPPRPPQEIRVPPRQPQSTISQGPRQSRPPLLGTRPHQPRNPVPVPNTSSLRPPVDTSGLVSSRIMRPDEFHRGATHTRYHPGNVRRTLSRGSSGGRSASGGSRGSSGERDEERRDRPRARAPAGGRAPYRPPSRGEVEYVEQAPRQEDQRRRAPAGGRTPYRPPSRGEENREVPRRSGRSPVRRIPQDGQAQVPSAHPQGHPTSRGQVMDRQERRRMEILREQQIARQQVDQLARGFEQIVASGEARTKAIQEEAAKKRTIMERAT